MIILGIMGGLGNQLYQYAFYKKLKQMKKNVKIDISRYDTSKVHTKDKRKLELNKFKGIEYETCTLTERLQYVDDSKMLMHKIKRKMCGNRTNIYQEKNEFDPDIFKMKDVYLSGYFTDYRYHDDVIETIQNELVFPQNSNIENDKIEHLINETQSVSIHIRREDYLEEKHKKIYGNICTKEYYEAAVAYLMEIVENPYFFIFSDDVEYVRKQIVNYDNITIIDWNNTEDASIFDMKLMSLCRYNICANSTFSYWGAMLNKNQRRIRIRPLRSNNLEMCDNIDYETFQPDWILIDKDGRISRT